MTVIISTTTIIMIILHSKNQIRGFEKLYYIHYMDYLQLQNNKYKEINLNTGKFQELYEFKTFPDDNYMSKDNSNTKRKAWNPIKFSSLQCQPKKGLKTRSKNLLRT